jgi:hypothetical protein
MFSLADFTAVLQSDWDSLSSDDAPTQFPGMPLDATRLSRWYEFWITQVSQPPARRGRQDQLQFLIDVHCYSRSMDKRQVMKMADRVRTHLVHRVLPMEACDSSETPASIIRLYESTVRDLTRESQGEPRLPLQHIVVSLIGTVDGL